MKSIEGRARTIRELLNASKYTIDFYQREYAWQERQVGELVDDLTGKFLDFYKESHERHEVERYGHYFLGSVVISHKRGQRFIVDGQQRLTTLTLLLLFLHHLQADKAEIVDISDLIYSEKYGKKSFNLDVPDRNDVMQRLLNGQPIWRDTDSESVQNIVQRYENLAEHFPEELVDKALPYFIDWLLENVHLVEIEAYSDEDAYTIFETMNDRGLSLSLPEMLKGYVLANIHNEADQRKVNTVWKQHMQAMKELGDEEDVDFFKNWLRARFASSIRPGSKGAENRDYERIGSEFHRWVRDQKDNIGLSGSDKFVGFVKRDIDFYATSNLAIRKACNAMTPGWESIFYNNNRGFTLQTQALLASLSPDDSPEIVKQKVALVADYLDIWLARRVWNFRTIAYSSVKYTLFTLTKELRSRDPNQLSAFLMQQLDDQVETFAGNPRLRLHQQNYRQIRHILARLTYWLDSQCGLTCHFEDLVTEGRARPFEIEHIWPDQYDQFAGVYGHTSDFEVERNRLGGLLLLQRGLNQSLGDKLYEIKREAYATKGENLLARRLHQSSYSNNPAFLQMIDRTGLSFRSYEQFGPAEQAERQELYVRLAEWVWNPSRLDLDGEKPPVHEPIVDPDEETSIPAGNGPHRHVARLAFWTSLLAVAKKRSDLHKTISPGKYHWIGARKHGQWWNYAVLVDEVRAELYIDGPEGEGNKSLFDQLHGNKESIEAEFGAPLFWQRLDDKRACRISYSVKGGWVDDQSWPRAIEQVVDAMERLYRCLAPAIQEIATKREQKQG